MVRRSFRIALPVPRVAAESFHCFRQLHIDAVQKRGVAVRPGGCAVARARIQPANGSGHLLQVSRRIRTERLVRHDNRVRRGETSLVVARPAVESVRRAKRLKIGGDARFGGSRGNGGIFRTVRPAERQNCENKTGSCDLFQVTVDFLLFPYCGNVAHLTIIARPGIDTVSFAPFS